MGSEPRDLGALEKAVNDAAGRASNLWISFVFFATLIAITTGTVTHKHLFLELPLKLPVLNVDLPLMGYFFAVPLFFVIFHFYMLLQLDGLSAKIEDYNAVLREQHPHATDRRLLRQRLDSFIFAQVLVGARDRREGRIGTLNRAVAWITMVGLPLGTLLLLQLMFLPYHHHGMTWWHRLCVLADLGLVWFFWARVGGAEDVAPAAPTAEERRPRSGAGALAALQGIALPQAARRISEWLRTGMRWGVARKGVAAGAVVALFTTLVAAYPTEWIHAAWFRAPLQPLTRLLLEGDVSLELLDQGKPWLASNRLMLADTDLGVEEKLVALAKIREALDPGIKHESPDQAGSTPRKVTLSLRDRDLSYANLLRADLRQVDLSHANMRGAILIQAQLQGANLRRAQLERADLVAARLQGAGLVAARLQGADLSEVQLQGADLSEAQLQGAHLGTAQLQGANLRWAQLQGAGLSQAQLQGADLREARLQGADFEVALLQGANLWQAELQGANLSEARLRGADLGVAQLQGADLRWAQLEGADLRRAQLQGADLSQAQLQGADLSQAQLQGANLRRAQLQGANLSEAQLQGVELAGGNVYRTGCPAPSNAQSRRCLHGAGVSIADTRHVDMHKSLQPQRNDTADGVNTAVDPAHDTAAFRKLIDEVLNEVPARAKQQAKKRLSVLEPGARTPEQDAQLVGRWQQERVQSLSPSRRADIIARVACGGDGAPHVARGLLRNGRLQDTRHHLLDIAAKMRTGKTDAAACPGVTGFLEADWQQLDELVAKAPPKPASAPSSPGK